MGIMIAGMDLSLTSTGYCSATRTTTIATKLRGAERLSFISRCVADFCKDDKIKVAIIEGYSFASRNSQAHSIGELGGCVRMTLWEAGIPFVDVPPTSRAKFATGKGNAGKSEVISAVSSKTGMTFYGSGADDECDAWLLREMALVKIGKSSHEWTKQQMEALSKIDWSPLELVVLGEK